MKQRCRDKPAYSGVSVHPSWLDFAAFLRDMGRKPTPRHTLDRIDNARGYEPGNCRWATPAEQQWNREATKLTPEDVRGIRGLLTSGWSQRDIAAKWGIHPSNISNIKRGRRWVGVQ